MANRRHSRAQRLRQNKHCQTTFLRRIHKRISILKTNVFLDDFPQELETSEITRMLCSVGFASPPDWLKSYDCLSQGEKMRVDIARALCLEQSLVVFDEFTSVVDREIAKVSAFAISKAVRRSKKQFIAVTCHYDVVDWLQPDWVFCTDTMEFSRKKECGRPLNSNPSVRQTIGRCFGAIII